VIRVLQVGKYYPPFRGGIESHVADLSVALKGRQIDVEVLVSNDKRETTHEVIDGIPVTRSGTLVKLASTPICPGMLAKLFQVDHDIVHLHLPSPLSAMALQLSQPASRLVVSYHSDIVKQKWMGKVYEPFLHRTLEKAVSIIVSSPAMIENSSVLKEHRDRCRVIPFGVPQQVQGQVNQTEIAELRKRFGSRIILGVGRLVYYKGFEYMIEAMRTVEGHLIIAGNGPMRESLQALIEKLGLSAKVSLLGSVSESQLKACYQVADVFVLPSVENSEAFGIVQIEAMAANTPVINTWLDSGVPYISLDGQTGITVAPRDSAALAGAANRLLGDPVLRAKYGEAARERANTVFSIQSMTNATIEAYREALGIQKQSTAARAAALA
jgi:glycosyltransferase involved in cell wall biosynthesis